MTVRTPEAFERHGARVCGHRCPAHPDWHPCQLPPGHDPAGGHPDSAGADVQHVWQDHGCGRSPQPEDTRPEVVQAVFQALIEMDPAPLLALEQAGSLCDALPDDARAEYDRRYGQPPLS